MSHESNEENDRSIKKWRVVQLDSLCELVACNSSRNTSPVAIDMAEDDTEHATVLGGDRLNHSHHIIATDTHNHQLMTT